MARFTALPAINTGRASGLLLMLAAIITGFLFPGTLHASTSQKDSAGTRVVVVGTDTGPRGWVLASVAETPYERYIGLSRTDELQPDSGMLFVYSREGDRTFVMRGMEYPLDIIFIGEDRRIRRIIRAGVDSRDEPGRRYHGRARWVLEVPFGWTRRWNIRKGHRVWFRSREWICATGIPSNQTRSGALEMMLHERLCEPDREDES